MEVAEGFSTRGRVRAYLNICNLAAPDKSTPCFAGPHLSVVEDEVESYNDGMGQGPRSGVERRHSRAAPG